MTVTQTENEVTVLEKDGRLRVLHLDNQGHKDDSGTETKTRWDKDHLVVETKPSHGAKLTETFRLSSEGRLVVTKLVESQSLGSVMIKQVYEPVAAQ